MRILEEHYDVVIAGGGGAALTAATVASDMGVRVLLVSKDPIGCGDTKISEGGITVRGSGSVGDSVETFFFNLRMRGRDLGDPELVRIFSQDSRAAYEWLRAKGLRPWPRPAGKGPQTYPMPMGGHNRIRSVPHPGGGLSFIHTLLGTGRERTYDAIQDAWFLDLIVNHDRQQGRKMAGALVYHAPRGVLLAVRAQAVVLATGGLGTLYFPNTDNMRGNTGDGHAVAVRAGAGLVDMEQIQFIPFALTRPRSMKGLFLGEPASAGPFGVLRDRNGRSLLTGMMYRTRAEVAGVLARAVAAGRGTENDGCYLDLSENVKGKSGRMYYRILQAGMQRQLDLVERVMGGAAARLEVPWEVQPSAHYCMGGVAVDASGKFAGEGVPEGLYAAGQVMGGLHGSDRLAGNSLAEIIIFGIRAGRAAAEHASGASPLESERFSVLSMEVAEPYRDALGREGEYHPVALMRELQKAAWKGIGPVRDADGIRKVLATAEDIRRRLSCVSVGAGTVWNQAFIDLIELENLLVAAEAVAHSALAREESLGAHVRLDEEKGLGKPGVARSVLVQRNDFGWQCSVIERKRTPAWMRFGDRLQTVMRQRGSGILRMLPFSVRDRVLSAFYGKIL